MMPPPSLPVIQGPGPANPASTVSVTPMLNAAASAPTIQDFRRIPTSLPAREHWKLRRCSERLEAAAHDRIASFTLNNS
jgi:hypothetical protein